MSKQKKEKVIHVDELIIHAKEVKIVSPVIEDDVPKRNPWSIFGTPRPRPTRAVDEKLDVHEDKFEIETNDLEEIVEDKTFDKEAVVDTKKGPRWI